MSDSAYRKDVEDVLTSVRRLVSNELPRTPRTDIPKGPGALVLTDAQRVQRPVSKGALARSLEDRIAELEAAVASRPDDYEPDGSEDQSQHRPDRIVYTRPPSEEQEHRARGAAQRLGRLSLVEPVSVPETAAEPDEPPASEPVTFRHAAKAARSAAVSDEPFVEDEPAIQDETPSKTENAPEAQAAEHAETAADDAPADDEAPMAEDVVDEIPHRAEVHRFHNPDDMLERFEARLNGETPSERDVVEGFRDRAPDFTPQPETSDAEQSGDMPRTALDTAQTDEDADPADRIADDAFEAALTEAVTSSLAGTAAPEAEHFEYVADTFSDDTASEDAAEAPPEPEPQPLDEAPLVAAAAAPVTVDEDTLRPLVAQLIREELQGELGERITRNVRKLVRREILRALSARDLE